jgi:hypothetical protein
MISQRDGYHHGVHSCTNTFGRPVAQQTSSMRIISACCMVPNLLGVMECGLLGISSGQLHHASPNFRAAYEQVDRLGCLGDQAVYLVDDDLLSKPKEAIIGRDVRWKVRETCFDVALKHQTALR